MAAVRDEKKIRDKAAGSYRDPALNAAPPIPEASYELRILQSLRRIIRAIEIHSQHLIHDYQITGPQLGCLLAIKQNGAMTPTRLARILYLSASTVVGIVDRLVEKGLLARIRSTEDRRQVQICLTEAGDHLAESAPSPLQETLSDNLKNLPALEQVSITLALDKLVCLMEAGEISAAPILETGPLLPPGDEKRT
ncbi:MAG: MarR family transcriptional regulator [Desulfuromonadales bacterium]|nr:MarR family transcriptional regulator [Desulfuromonadales bacterium]